MASARTIERELRRPGEEGIGRIAPGPGEESAVRADLGREGLAAVPQHAERSGRRDELAAEEQPESTDLLRLEPDGAVGADLGVHLRQPVVLRVHRYPVAAAVLEGARPDAHAARERIADAAGEEREREAAVVRERDVVAA